MNRSPRRLSERRESPRRGHGGGGGGGGDRSPSRMYQPSSGPRSSSGAIERSPPRQQQRPSPRRGYSDTRGGSPRRGSYGGDRSPRRPSYGGRGGERRDRSFWSSEPRDMERSWRSGEQPPPPPRGTTFTDRRDRGSDRGKSRSPRSYDGGSYPREYPSGSMGGRVYRGRGGRGRRDGSRSDGDAVFGRSNGPAIGINGGPMGGYAPETSDGKYGGLAKSGPVDTTKFNTSQALKMFADRWQVILSDLHNDDLPATEKPKVYQVGAGRNVWGMSKLPLQAPVPDFLGELQKALAASKEGSEGSPTSPSD